MSDLEKKVPDLANQAVPTEASNPRQKLSYLDEYKEAGTNMRHYGTHFAALLSVFLALTGGLISLTFKENAGHSDLLALGLRGLGVILSLGFSAKLESVNFLWGHFLRRAAAIEFELGFQQYRSLPSAPNFRLRPARWAARVVCSTLTLFWIIATIRAL